MSSSVRWKFIGKERDKASSARRQELQKLLLILRNDWLEPREGSYNRSLIVPITTGIKSNSIAIQREPECRPVGWKSWSVTRPQTRCALPQLEIFRKLLMMWI